MNVLDFLTRVRAHDPYINLNAKSEDSEMKRNIYLEDIPLDEALSTFINALRQLDLWQALGSESIKIENANGRILAQPLWAKISSPHYYASAMDGFALRSADTRGASETNPITLEVVEQDEVVKQGSPTAAPVNTGQPLPSWSDCVVMIEQTQPEVGPQGEPNIKIYSSLPPWNHVRPMGEDIVAGELVLPAGHRIRPVDLGAVAAAGYDSVSVCCQPKVAIIPTGSELVEIGSRDHYNPQPGQIIEFNSLILAAQVENWGGLARRWPIVSDVFDQIKSAVTQAAEDHDLLLVNAGSSAGSEDYTAAVVSSLGQLLVHGVAVRPGHPVILGLIDKPGGLDSGSDARGKKEKVPIIGVPGYPVSATLTGEIFVQPLLARWQGITKQQVRDAKAKVTRKVTSPMGDDDFIRVTLGRVNKQLLAAPLNRGAGVITSLVRADGLVKIPRFSEGVDAGTVVDVILYRSVEEIEETILAVGSHDMVLDLLAQFLAQGGSGKRLTSANVGSLGGLIALGRGESHIAGSHLLDQQTGLYNASFIEKYLPGQNIVLLTLVGREQGWIVPKGNPKGLTGWIDVSNPDIEIVNRQRGSGTRQLLDYELKKAGLTTESVRGYDRQEYTHLAVAAAVSAGSADAGLGIRAAASALGNDFIPLSNERFDLVMPLNHYESDHLRPLIDLLYNREFKRSVEQMPGYNIGITGEKKTITANQ